jgi:hypothetical protein
VIIEEKMGRTEGGSGDVLDLFNLHITPRGKIMILLTINN